MQLLPLAAFYVNLKCFITPPVRFLSLTVNLSSICVVGEVMQFWVEREKRSGWHRKPVRSSGKTALRVQHPLAQEEN